MKSLLITMAFTLALISVACKSDSTNNPTGTSPDNNKTTVTMGGTTYALTATALRILAGGMTTLTITCSDISSHVYSIQLINITTTGQFDIGTANSTTMQAITMTYQDGTGTVYATGTDGGASVGTMHITTNSSSHFQATFDATLTGSGGGTLHVTNGSVNVDVH